MAKKPYEKPKVSKVNLKTSEAVLTPCKWGGWTGPWGQGEQGHSCKIGGWDCQIRTKS